MLIQIASEERPTGCTSGFRGGNLGTRGRAHRERTIPVGIVGWPDRLLPEEMRYKCEQDD